MSRNSFKKNRIKGGFVTLGHRLLDSEEWQTLTPKTKEIYIYICRKFNGNNTNDIRFTYKEAKAKYKISQPTLRRAIADLEKTGIIIIIQKGGLFHQPTIISLKGKFWTYHEKRSA